MSSVVFFLLTERKSKLRFVRLSVGSRDTFKSSYKSITARGYSENPNSLILQNSCFSPSGDEFMCCSIELKENRESTSGFVED